MFVYGQIHSGGITVRLREELGGWNVMIASRHALVGFRKHSRQAAELEIQNRLNDDGHVCDESCNKAWKSGI
jgi:hypothetical protein